MTEDSDASDRAIDRYRRLLALLPARYVREAGEELSQIASNPARRQKVSLPFTCF
jgi:hypothetical protein